MEKDWVTLTTLTLVFHCDPESGSLSAHSGLKQKVTEYNQMTSDSHFYHKKNKYPGYA